MRSMHPHTVRVAAILLTISFVSLASIAPKAYAQAVVGFREEWVGLGNLAGWGGGSVYDNPGAGGYLGDGYLQMSATAGKLGAMASTTDFAGDWQAAGITQVRVWLNDVNADDPIEIHACVGNGANFWEYNVGFVPPNGQWAEYVVDLTNSANFTRILGTGTFASALQNADRLLFRHDLAPFVQTPDNVTGDVGIDHLLLTNGVVSVDPATPRVPRALTLSAPTPNPARGDVRFAIQSYDASPIAVDILDITGRRIRHATLEGAAGARSWTWDGRDDAGRLTGPSIYRIRAVGNSGGATRSVVRIR